MIRPTLTNARRLVVKIGSALITNNGQGIDQTAISDWCAQIANLVADGRELVLVSSGAIACGMRTLGWTSRPQAMSQLQAAAAIGQMDLCQIYRTTFAAHQLTSAQILLTHDDLSDRSRYLNARATLIQLLALGVVPIINENDTVVTDEIKFGDNDTLAALVANLLEADLLVILTDQQGLYTADPRQDPQAQHLSTVVAGDPALELMASGTTNHIAKGGMITKVIAAKRAARSGAHTFVGSGREANVLARLLADETIGTLFVSTMQPIAARKQWIADHLQLSGALVIDEGAKQALLSGKSLLPVGVKQLQGQFERGNVVACIDTKGKEIARGLVNYNSQESARILGLASQEISDALGYLNEPELIHRNNLVLL